MKIITTVIALLLAVANINAQEKMKENVNFNVWPKGELNTAYAKYFIGNSYLAPLDADNGGPVNVTFEPRCRNNWHKEVLHGAEHGTAEYTVLKFRMATTSLSGK